MNYKVVRGVPYQLLFSNRTKISEVRRKFQVLAPQIASIADIIESASQQERVNFYAVVTAIGVTKSVKQGTYDLRDIEFTDDSPQENIIFGSLWNDALNHDLKVNDIVYINNGETNIHSGNKKINIYNQANI